MSTTASIRLINRTAQVKDLPVSPDLKLKPLAGLIIAKEGLSEQQADALFKIDQVDADIIPRQASHKTLDQWLKGGTALKQEEPKQAKPADTTQTKPAAAAPRAEVKDTASPAKPTEAATKPEEPKAEVKEEPKAEVKEEPKAEETTKPSGKRK